MELSLDQQVALVALIAFSFGEELSRDAVASVPEITRVDEVMEQAQSRYDEKDMLALSGPAGSGKTTLIKALYTFLDKQGWYEFAGSKVRPWISLTATTHKAAHVLEETSGFPAQTIHSRLNLRPAKEKNGQTKLKRKDSRRAFNNNFPRVLVVDEASMIDMDLLKIIAEDAQDYDFKVLFVGDSYQLPPVKSQKSPVFEHVPSIHLETIHRQALENPVLAFATQFRRAIDGERTPIISPLGDTLEHVSQEDFEAQFIDEFAHDSAIGKIKALCWTNNRVWQLNTMVRERVLGPLAAHQYNVGEVLTTNNPVMHGDRVVVPNGAEVEIIEHLGVRPIDADGLICEIAELKILFGDTKLEINVPVEWEQAHQAKNRLRSKALRYQKRFYAGEAHLEQQRSLAWREFYALEEGLADLRPPYASTVHKAQGSTYERVYIDVGDIGRNTHNSDILRLMYTALTRPRTRVIMTGDLPSRLYIDKEAG